MKKQIGFTIVELLIVVVVVAILAAVSIVAYNGIKNRANDASVQSSLEAFAKKAELFNVDNSRYPTSVSELTSLGWKINQSSAATVNYNAVYCWASNGSGYALQILSTSRKRLYVTESGIKEFTDANLWTGTDNALRCSQTIANYSGNTAGYSSSTWAAWTR